ncbi:hypothetical protein GCM10023148_17690 [Actinokineospora soli]
MHAEALYRLAAQRHQDDIAHAERTRLVKAAARKPEVPEPDRPRLAPRPRYA